MEDLGPVEDIPTKQAVLENHRLPVHDASQVFDFGTYCRLGLSLNELRFDSLHLWIL